MKVAGINGRCLQLRPGAWRLQPSLNGDISGVGGIGSEGTGNRHCAICPRSEAAPSAQLLEKGSQNGSALVLQHAGRHVECMVETLVTAHVVQRSHRAALGGVRAEHAPVDASVHH